MLADEGVYLASESTFSRVLRTQGDNTTLIAGSRYHHAKVVA